MYKLKANAEYISINLAEHKSDVSLHYHESRLVSSFDFEIAYVIGGEGVHFTEHTSEPIRCGSYIFVDYGVWHGYKVEGDEPLRLINITFDHRAIDVPLEKGKTLTHLAKQYFILPRDESCESREDFVFYDSDGKTLDTVLEIKREYEQRLAGYYGFIKSGILKILLTGFRSYFKENEAKGYSKEIQVIADYLSYGYMTDVTLSEFSEKLSLSLPHLSKKFKAETGHSYTEYLAERRIKESARLLSDSSDSIENIASYVGYSDSKKYREKFKTIMGMTPREYRKLYKAN